MNIKKGIMGIYKITSPSNKIYIGSSMNIRSRFLRYKNLHCKEQHKIYRSILKYGWDSHTFEIIEKCEFENLYNRERYWQEFYDCIGKNGLNCCYVNTDEKPLLISDETKRKLSEKNKGKKMSEENKKKLAERMKNTIMKDSTKEKMRQFFTGKPNPKNGRKIVNIKTNETYNSVSELSKVLNIKYSQLFEDLSNYYDIGYKFIDYEGVLKPKPAKRKVNISVKHIPSQMVFNSITEAALYFNKNNKTLADSIKKNSFNNEFEYLDSEMKPKKKNNKKAVVHLETNLNFNSMREAEIYFNFDKGYVKNNIRSKNSKFKILE